MDNTTAGLFSKLIAIGAGSRGIAAEGTILRAENQLSDRRHAAMRGYYAGKTAFIVTCGPSLNDVWSDKIRYKLSDQLVISIKQTQHMAPEIADFHLYNEIRMESYDYGKFPTIRLGVSKFQYDHPPHIHYPIQNYRYEDALFVTNNYDKWTLDKGIKRPWGVGILFELALHLPLFLGCRAAVIIGFDMNPKGQYHYYDSSSTHDARFYQVDDAEFGYAKRSSAAYVKWANSKGLESVLLSPRSSLDIPKISLEELDGYLRPS